MTEPTTTSTGIAYLTFDATLNTDASMIIQQKLDLSGNTSVQTFCENAFNLAAERDISSALLADSDITDYSTNNLVYLGSNDLNVQKTFLNNKLNSSIAQNIITNAYKMSLGKNNQIPLVSNIQSSPEPEPEPEPIPEPEPEPIPEPEPEPEPGIGGAFEALLITIPTYYWEFRIDDTSSELQTQNNGDIVIKDSIGNRNATIVQGSSSISTSNFSIANGLDLTSQEAYIDLGSQLLDNMMENFSCELNLERGTNTWKRILLFGESVSRNLIELADKSSSTLHMRTNWIQDNGTNGQSGYDLSNSNSNLHVVLVYNRGTPTEIGRYKIYIDGVFVTRIGWAYGSKYELEQTASNALNNIYRLCSRTTNTGDFWSGKIDYCRLWRNYLLSETEITELYNNRNNILK